MYSSHALDYVEVYFTALLHMASPSPVLGGSPQSAGNRIRDSLATSLGKSYGTVKDASLNMSSSYRSVINHDVVEEDTLQGLALKYNVTVSLLNTIPWKFSLWSNDKFIFHGYKFVCLLVLLIST